MKVVDLNSLYFVFSLNSPLLSFRPAGFEKNWLNTQLQYCHLLVLSVVFNLASVLLAREIKV